MLGNAAGQQSLTLDCRPAPSCAQRTCATNCWMSMYPTRPVPSTYRKPTVTAAGRVGRAPGARSQSGAGWEPGPSGEAQQQHTQAMRCSASAPSAAAHSCPAHPSGRSGRWRTAKRQRRRGSWSTLQGDGGGEEGTSLMMEGPQAALLHVLGSQAHTSAQAATLMRPCRCHTQAPSMQPQAVPLTQVEHKLEAVVGAPEERQVDGWETGGRGAEEAGVRECSTTVGG